jgi:prophage regulatory protein
MQNTTPQPNISAMRLGEVLRRTGLSRPSVYRLIANNKFPKPAKLSERVSAWNEAEIIAWLEAKFSEAN